MNHDSMWQNSSVPDQGQQLGDPGIQNGLVPLVPEWIISGGYLFIAPTALAVIWAIVHIGRAAGADAAWALFAVVACGTARLWWLGYRRRVEARETLEEQALYQLHEIAKVDAMAGRQFELYCAVLLRARGYRHVSITGGTDHDQGVDIIAVDPAGVPVAIQCKRWRASVGPDVIRELLGAVLSGSHGGRTGVIMTNALVTAGATSFAQNHGIGVIDRPVLHRWINEARDEIEARGHAPYRKILSSPDGMRPAARVLAGILCSALVLLILLVFPPVFPGADATGGKPDSRAAASAPETVIREFFGAINAHHWRALWRLWYHSEPGYGPGYRKMISGFRLTARDVITNIESTGDTVTARVLAYEKTGAVQTLRFTYRVHRGKITWGRSDLLRTSYPRQSSVAHS